jgi:hypothetical protein
MLLRSILRYFFRRHFPPSKRVLLIESGSRKLIELALPSLRAMLGEDTEFDLVTCYPGEPQGVNGRILRVTDYGPDGRGRLWADLARREYTVAGQYTVAGMICSAEPIMTKWKWWLAAKLPAKIFVINENADYFWLDWAHRGLIRRFVAYRAGLTGSAAVPALVRFFLFPLTLTYLILYACTVHLRRKIRML